MNQQSQPNQPQSSNIQGFIADARVYLNEDRGTLTHVITNEIRIEMPANLYKKVLGLEFEPKVSRTEVATAPSRKPHAFGLVARPSIYLSRDGEYLIHRVLGIRVSKHVNYYKKILGAEFTPKAQQSA